MKVSVLGTGRMGKGIAKVLAPRVEHLWWGSRSPERAGMLARELRMEGVTPVTYDEALQADVIIHTFWFRHLLPWAEQARERLKGKILVDIANPFSEDYSDFTLDWGTSAAEELQRLLPETKVAGAFKNTYAALFDRPVHQGAVSDVYVTSDDEEVRRTVMRLFRRLPFRVLDGGRLANNRTIERMTLFAREMALRYGSYPYVSFQLFGLPDEIRESGTLS